MMLDGVMIAAVVVVVVVTIKVAAPLLARDEIGRERPPTLMGKRDSKRRHLGT